MHDSYENPLCKRYAGETMKKIFSDDTKFSTWRKLWVALAESEQELGIDITDAQIQEMRDNIYNIDYDFAAAREREVRHDVMAHVLTYGELCPEARPIIHLGATSCYVGDNTDIILMRQGMEQIRKLLVNTLAELSKFAQRYKAQPTLAYTHFQAAQPTTVGKRATLWIQDLLLDLEALEFQMKNLKLLGCKGTTGTCASFLELFDGDQEKVELLEKKITEKMGFDAAYPVSGQTYSRKVDFYVLQVLSGIAQSAAKFSNDIRLLSHLKEVDEPFEEKQIGSSAMAYKRNPMRSERIASLARYVICDLQNAAFTASTQWFERTLDDSANRRISIPEAFLAVDGILTLYINIISGLKVYPGMVEKHLKAELPFMATENILMYCVKEKGGDRATICMPYHRLLDQLEEDRLGDKKFGSTRRGISPVYADKYMKKTLRMGDLLHPDTLREKLEGLIEWKNLTVVGGYGHEAISVEEMLKWLETYGLPWRDYICNTTEYLSWADKKGKSILFEAQLGALRDIDFGIYPYTSASSTIAAYAPIGAGVPGLKLDQVVGIMKAYSSCVGEGPFTCELFGADGNALREAGGEYGAATGRPRRVGGFDIVASRYGVQMQGASCLALTKLDVLSYMDQIPICVAYEIDGQKVTDFPVGDDLARAKPVYEYFPGFGCDISGCRRAEELPGTALAYIKALEAAVECPIRYVSVGPERDQYIEMF
jgi:adenylosuccinate lyase